jgi:hypothetical protein
LSNYIYSRQDPIIVYSNEINCGIFRHAIFKSNLQQINPHETKENCNKYIANNLVYGCAKSFQLIKQNNNYVIQIWNYI